MSSEEQTKPLCIKWSKLIAETTTIERLIPLQEQLQQEAGEIISKAFGWFFHFLMVKDMYEGNEVVCQCIGREEDDHWNIFVRLATYESYPFSSDENSNSDCQEKAVCIMPTAVEHPNNELFASFYKCTDDDDDDAME